MANLNASESLEQKGTLMVDSNVNVLQPSMIQPKRTSSDGPVAILWDIENCPVPSDVRPEDVAGNIRMALRVHPVITGAVMMFSAYGDFNAFPRRLREGCQRTGVKLIDVPNGRKDAADKAILVDMFLFALDNPPPSSIMLISGDVDFAPALHILGQRGYIVILVIPARSVSSALCSAGKFVWDWPSVACGEGFVPPSKALMPPRGGPADISGCFMGCHIGDNPDGQNEEEAIIYKGFSQSCYNSRDFTIVSQSLSEYTSNPSVAIPSFPATSRSQSLPSGLSEVPGCPSVYDQNDVMWVQPGDINGLKGQLVKLLELSGGCMPYPRSCRMGDTLAIEGKGHKRFVYLRNWKSSPSAPPLALGAGSSDKFSDEERVVVEECDERRNNGAASYDVDDRNLEQFKYELQEILVSYSCRIFLGCFDEVYHQRYKKMLDYRKLGVEKLEELFDKVRDVVVLHEEPVSKRKFLCAVGS
ncbi:putative receptor-like protein kinase [Hibiscus syriacus]|uniref:Receptor-like protein kinase n=1 Tax=Hibiscus syriacus TaxID=106335 RepID=A0A6A2Z464_HIBSY|nr:putative receptor-like protein kinase [Hibiscus syriacus]